MKFIPEVNIFYKGKYYAVGTTIETDGADADELRRYGHFIVPEKTEDEQPVKKGRTKKSEK